ncbi:MAG: hypothetical protein LUE93_02515 [Bacteroides sp.]|nr:hypothetical protein [Bacteroides sp.]
MKVFLSIKKIKAIVEIEWDYPVFPKADDKICISDFIDEDFSNIFKEEEYDIRKKALIPYKELKEFDYDFIEEIKGIKENTICMISSNFKFRRNQKGETYCILYANL